MSNFDKLIPHCTVRLIGIVGEQAISTGTGFYYLFNDTFTRETGELNPDGTAFIGIVTNRHVIEGMEEVMFFFNSTEEHLSDYVKDSLRVKLNEETVIFHPDDDIDLCVILIHDLSAILRGKNRKFHMHPIRKQTTINQNHLKNMSTIQNLIMVGYPKGLWDSVNNLPLIRKGINATPLYADYEGREEFALDIATYRGSSGSPVFIYDNGAYVENNEVKFGNRIIFAGIIKAVHLSTTEHTESIKTEEMLHIGIAIKASKLNDFEELIRKHYKV